MLLSLYLLVQHSCFPGDRHVRFNNELDIRYRTTSEEGSTSTYTSNKSVNQDKRGSGFLKDAFIDKFHSLDKSMARKNVMKQNFDMLVNDKCSWSYKSQKIIKASNTVDQVNKVQSTLTTIQVSQQRSYTDNLPKSLKKKTRNKEKVETKSNKVAEKYDAFPGLFDSVSRHDLKERYEFSDVINKSAPSVTETLSSMSSCSSENAAVLLSRNIAGNDDFSNCAESNNMRTPVRRTESSPLITPHSELNGALLHRSDIARRNLKKDDFSQTSTPCSKFDAEELAVRESGTNLEVDNEILFEDSIGSKKSSLAPACQNKQPHRKSKVILTSSLSAESPSSHGDLENICNDIDSISSSNLKEGRSASLKLNECLPYNDSPQQRKYEIENKTLTFADEVWGVCEELKSHTFCTNQDIFDDFMNGTFSIKKYQEREQEFKAPVKVSSDPEGDKKAADRTVLNKQKTFHSSENGSNVQESSFAFVNSKSHLVQRETSVLKKNIKLNTKAETSTHMYLRSDKPAVEKEIYPNQSPLGLNLNVQGLKKHGEGSKNSLAHVHGKSEHLYSTDEMKATISNGEGFPEEQNMNKMLSLQKKTNKSINMENLSEISSNDYEEASSFSCKPMKSMLSDDSSSYYKRENAIKSNSNTSPSDVDERDLTFRTKIKNSTPASGIKRSKFKKIVSSKNPLKKDTKRLHETHDKDSISEVNEFDINVNKPLLVGNSECGKPESSNKSLLKEADIGCSIDYSKLHEDEIPHSLPTSPSQTSNENSSLVPEKKILNFPDMSEKNSFKTKRVVKNKNEKFLMGFDLERNAVKYNLRKKRTDISPKQHQSEAKATAPRKSLKKVASKQNVRKAKQNSKMQNNKAKHCENPISSFTRSSPLPTLRKRLTCHALELENRQQQKRPKTWDDIENEILQNNREDQHSVTRSVIKTTPNNTGFSAISRKDNSKMTSGKTAKSVPRFSDSALNFTDSGATTDLNFQHFNDFQIQSYDQTPNQFQSSQSKIIVEKTLAAMQKCKLDYEKQVGVCEENFLDGTLSSNSDCSGSMESEDSVLNRCPPLNAGTPENTLKPLSLKRHTQFTYTNSTIQNRSATNEQFQGDKIKYENNVIVEFRSNYCIEDSGFLENFTGNQIKESSSNINSTPANPWESMEKRLQLREDDADDYSKRPIVHYLKKACDTFEENKNYLQIEKFAHSSVETTSTDSDFKQVGSSKQKKNLKVNSFGLESEMKNKKKYYWNRVSSEESDIDDVLSVEDSEEELQGELKHSNPKSKSNFSSDHDNLDNEYQKNTRLALKLPSPEIPTLETETVPLETIDTNQANGVSSCESEGTLKVNGMTIDDKMRKLPKHENKKASNKSSVEVLLETNDVNHRKCTFRGKDSKSRILEGVSRRRRRPRKKIIDTSSEDDTFDPFLRTSTPKPMPQLKIPKQHNISPKTIDTIDLSSESEKEKREEKKASTQRNGKIKKRKPKEKYVRYVGKLLQREYATTENSQASSQMVETKNVPLRKSCILAENADDQFSISSSGSEVGLRGVGLLCDILAE